MAKYCDTTVLERNWFEWIVASSTPQLECFRRSGGLYTKIVGTVPGTKIPNSIPDPHYEERWHIVPNQHLYFITINTKTPWIIPYTKEPDCNYYQERTEEQCWHSLLDDIGQMCRGIVCKFNQPSDEAKANLANEAFLQVASKLKRGKLNYMPGRAPVFNLLTTTIHRCIYSALSKDKRQHRNLVTLTDNLIAQTRR